MASAWADSGSGASAVNGMGATPAARGACACSVAQSCLTLCDLVNCSPPGSSVHGARIPE